jgi:hypothetical protein
MTMTWLYFLVPLGMNVNVSSFLLWYDAHTCSAILESLIKLPGASQTRWLERKGHPSYQEDYQGYQHCTVVGVYC